ncbi:MAG: NAD-dependent epimerase/dehydratase family protein [Candidatus Tectimicrobiota bacterium]
MADLPFPRKLSRPPETLRLALIGCGAIAEQMHLPVLAGHQQVKLTALVDRNLQRVRRFAEGYGIAHVFTDTSDLTRDLVDAAVVATPPFHHAPCTIDLVQRGIHVLVEKPMATCYADAVQMVEAAAKAGVVLSVGYFRRLYPSLRLLQSLLESGWAGQPQQFLVEGGGMYNWAAATLGNMHKDLAGGGVLIDFGSHMLDLMFALFDEPTEVLEYRDNSLGGIEADCSIHVRVQHLGRPVEGRIELARTRELGSFIRVECERATLEFMVNERFRVKVTPVQDRLMDPVAGEQQQFWFEASWRQTAEDESWYATFARQFDDWFAAIRTGREPVLSGQSALATARLIEACYQKPQHLNEAWVWHGITPETRPSRYTTKANHKPRILVTGASGFIGCRVAEMLRLREKCDVRAVVHNPGNASRLARLDVDMVQADLGNVADIERLVEDCDAVVHCAIGTDWGEPRKIFHVTVDGTRHLAEAALRARVDRFVHISTMSVYGDDSILTGLLDETTPVQPLAGSVYGESKAAAERLVLALASQGLPAVVFRPARVFGPFSRIFITRPLQAIARHDFAWLGSPDVPCDMVYIDNVVEALLCSLFADAAQVTGQVFNIGDGDRSTWRDFYQYFAESQGFDLTGVPVATPFRQASVSGMSKALAWPTALAQGFGKIITSREFKALGRRVLQTDPIGALPRAVFGRFPALESHLRRCVGADDALPVYTPSSPVSHDPVVMGSGGAVLSIAKLRSVLGFEPPVSRERALGLTLDWARHARIISA